MPQTYITIYEAYDFSKKANKLLTKEAHNMLVDYLSKNPEKGSVIRGTGGLRKLRWSYNTKGKRGGARIIYFYYMANYEILLLTIYIKNTKQDLTSDDKKALRKLVEQYLK